MIREARGGIDVVPYLDMRRNGERGKFVSSVRDVGG